MVRDEAHLRAQATLQQFRSAIRPIYGSVGKTLPVHLGTCTLLRVGTVKLIVTAAHIIDQYSKAGLWVGGDNKLTPLAGMFSGTAAPNGDRKLDKYDFSASSVDAELAAGLGNVSYIEPKFISKGRRQDGKHAMYACIGYPNSQNKKMHATKREIDVRMWMHVSKGRSTHDALAPWATRTTEHLFVEFDKYAATVEGRRRSSTDPTGTSGGPIFYLGNFNDPEIYRSGTRFQPMLEGILIERSRTAKVLVGVKIAPIIHALHFAGLLPAPESRAPSASGLED